MPAPTHTALANRRAVSIYLEQIQHIVDTPGLTEDDVDAVTGLAQLMLQCVRRIKSAESLIDAAPRQQSLHPLIESIATAHFGRPA